MRKIMWLLIFLVLISSSYALTIKYTTASHPIAKALWQMDFIIIYNVDERTDEEINELLVHEYQHQLCWDLFGIYPENLYDHSERCFVE